MGYALSNNVCMHAQENKKFVALSHDVMCACAGTSIEIRSMSCLLECSRALHHFDPCEWLAVVCECLGLCVAYRHILRLKYTKPTAMRHMTCMRNGVCSVFGAVAYQTYNYASHDLHA